MWSHLAIINAENIHLWYFQILINLLVLSIHTCSCHSNICFLAYVMSFSTCGVIRSCGVIKQKGEPSSVNICNQPCVPPGIKSWNSTFCLQPFIHSNRHHSQKISHSAQQQAWLKKPAKQDIQVQMRTGVTKEWSSEISLLYGIDTLY